VECIESGKPPSVVTGLDGLSAVEYAALLEKARTASEESPANV